LDEDDEDGGTSSLPLEVDGEEVIPSGVGNDPFELVGWSLFSAASPSSLTWSAGEDARSLSERPSML
jgi:hypothetical protein